VADPQRTFYVALQPINDNSTAESLAVSRLPLEELAERDLPPVEAWLGDEIPSDYQYVGNAMTPTKGRMSANQFYPPARSV
jgi:hypothetical protein